GKNAYAELTRIAEDGRLCVEDRGHAIKCVAKLSQQLFDRRLPSNPGEWRETDLRLHEMRAWASNGYPDRQGYSEPSETPRSTNQGHPWRGLPASLIGSWPRGGKSARTWRSRRIGS